MATLQDIQEKIYRLLDEVDADNADEDLILDAIGASLDEILPWIPNLQITTLSQGSRVYELPADFYSAEAVLDSNGDPLPRAQLIVGSYFGESSDPNGWILFPSGSITFAQELDDDHTFYYVAQWEKPTTGTNPSASLDFPDYATQAVCLYATAYCLLPDAVSIAELRQFNTRTDSGNPEHNPRQKAFEFLLKLFKDCLSRVPKYQRVGE